MARRIVREILEDVNDANEPPIRKYLDLLNPFDGLSDTEIMQKYRFPPTIIIEITDLVRGDLEKPTKRNRPIPPLIEVCISLRYLASNGHQQVIKKIEYNNIFKFIF